MDTRILKEQELLPALHLVWEVFAEEVAPSYSPEGVEEFRNFIKYDNICPMFRRGELLFFGAFEDNELKGTMAFRRDGHISLFFVCRDSQGRGIGRSLCEAAAAYCAQVLRVDKATVNAAPGAVAHYESLGFQAAGEEQVVNGIRFLPMELAIDRSAYPSAGKSRTPLIVGLAIGSVLLLAILIFGISIAVRGIGSYIRERHSDVYEEPYDDRDRHDYGDDYGNHDYGGHDRGEYNWDDYDGSYGDGEALSGLESIPAYEAGDLEYETEEKVYAYTDDEKTSMVVDFQVKYPQINGLDEELGTKVNGALKDCAMETVDKIYTNPSESVKEGVLASEYPALVSYVEYKISYINNEFVSVIFQDYSYQGDSSTYYVDLRARNISLRDGTVYELKDIVNTDAAFMNEWLEGMKDEADDSSFLSELSREQMESALKGDSQGGVYVANFFADADGIEIGFDFNYEADDPDDHGYAWVTAPFDFSDIREYKTNSAFWDEID
ncbi:GNAT family N-acetyltransferase [Clostridium sp. AF15-17LB]|nr:GNAT family N-acetyltransferase [Clostridium sp. AF15-17LB]